MLYEDTRHSTRGRREGVDGRVRWIDARAEVKMAKFAWTDERSILALEKESNAYDDMTSTHYTLHATSPWVLRFDVEHGDPIQHHPTHRPPARYTTHFSASHGHSQPVLPSTDTRYRVSGRPAYLPPTFSLLDGGRGSTISTHRWRKTEMIQLGLGLGTRDIYHKAYYVA